MHEFTNPFMIITILRLSHKAHKCIQNFINYIKYILRNDKLQPLGINDNNFCMYRPTLAGTTRDYTDACTDLP